MKLRVKSVVKDLSKTEMEIRRFWKAVSSSKEMEIPQAFVLQVQGGLPNTVFLRDRYENLWSVEVSRIGYKWYFKKGWPEFYKENSLEPLNLMLFEHRGGGLLDFKLLGDDACEKKGVGHLKMKVKEVDLEEYEDEEEVEDQNDDDDGDYDIDDYDNGDYVQEEDLNASKKSRKSKSSRLCSINLSGVGVGKVHSKRTCRKKNVSEKGVRHLTYKVKEEKEDEEDERPNISKKIKPNPKSKSCSRADLQNTLGSASLPSRRGYERKSTIADCYGADIFKSRAIPKPKNPYFVTRSRTARRKNDLYIPKDVIVDYHLKKPKRLFFVDEKGTTWKTEIKEWKDGRWWCKKGWGSLCNVNHIDKDEACICEFVQGQTPEDLYIKVRVLSRILAGR